jgi:ribosome-associated translation inhibitor RaiA
MDGAGLSPGHGQYSPKSGDFGCADAQKAIEGPREAASMVYSDESYNLRIELDTKHCELTGDEIRKMEEDLGTLRKLVEEFPVANLYVTVVYHPRSTDYHVKTSLALPGRTLFTGERDEQVHPAYDRCVRKLVRKVNDYKADLQQRAELSKRQQGTHQTVSPAGTFEVGAAEQAVEIGDYVEFRRALDGFEEPLRKRIGRWIQRYPEIESRLGQDIKIADLVEEVFLNAFEQFANRPHEVPPGDWLQELIDPSVQALLGAPDEEFANISFARSLGQIEQGE